MQQLLSKLKDRPFYIWNKDRHKQAANPNSESRGFCCFNDIIGRPKKDGKEFPLFDYEYMVYKALTHDSYLNNRSPTPEEAEAFRLEKIQLEKLTEAQTGSIKRAQDEFLKEKDKTLVHDFKRKHVAILKASGLGITELIPTE